MFYAVVQLQEISIPKPRKVVRNFEEERFSKANYKFFKESKKLNWNFQWGEPGEVGFKPRNLPMKRCGYF